jgi:hydrogenase nickel incorporation protein HypA/HybF
MHELSVAQNIADIALSTAEANQAKQVTAVELEIGLGAGIEPSALELAWDSVSRDTLLDGSELIIRYIPVTMKCRNCSHQFTPEEIFDPCPKCAAFGAEMISGKEMRVVSIEI